MLKKTSTEIVVQSNYLVESSYRLNFQEKRLIAWLSTKIRKDDDLNSCLEVNWELIRKTVCDILPLNYLLHF